MKIKKAKTSWKNQGGSGKNYNTSSPICGTKGHRRGIVSVIHAEGSHSSSVKPFSARTPTASLWRKCTRKINMSKLTLGEALYFVTVLLKSTAISYTYLSWKAYYCQCEDKSCLTASSNTENNNNKIIIWKTKQIFKEVFFLLCWFWGWWVSSNKDWFYEYFRNHVSCPKR